MLMALLTRRCVCSCSDQTRAFGADAKCAQICKQLAAARDAGDECVDVPAACDDGADAGGE